VLFIALPTAWLFNAYDMSRVCLGTYMPTGVHENDMSERRIKTDIEINAPAALVWSILTDFAGMPSWNPFITSISGELTQGARLAVTVAPPGKSGMSFKPTLLSLRPERELRWLGRVLFPGIFDGEHYFLLESMGGERTRLTHGENYSGLLVGMLRSQLDATAQGFTAMNVALKQEAERNATAAARVP
jgi:hypothetical protein